MKQHVFYNSDPSAGVPFSSFTTNKKESIARKLVYNLRGFYLFAGEIEGQMIYYWVDRNISNVYNHAL
jgi:hypothetical protein